MNASTILGLAGGALVAVGVWKYVQEPTFVAKPNESPRRRSALTMLEGPYQQGLFVGDALAGSALPNPAGILDVVNTAIGIGGKLIGQGVSGSQAKAEALRQQQLLEQQAAIAAAQAQAAQAGAGASTKQTFYWVAGGVVGLTILGGLGLIGYRMTR